MKAPALLLALALLPSALLAQPGSTCTQPLSATVGTQLTAPLDDTWYVHTPAADGTLLVKTCGHSTCDTRIAVYDHCDGLVTDDAGLNAIAYSDNACGEASMVAFPVTAGTTYWIRIMDHGNDCGAANARWSMTFDPACSPGEVS